ncbi:hypothetical membrane protein [Thermoplasma acidophilum]|uniref:Hypothetical membrane protein n=1 Tax=Thermoplasma acidophilum (strain ATCC 25905 / DSM 1728 / JCM 9062 / NBRC 15155 / AMRC-C165) TaxID=273075 RepID=Q9HJE4_THEAC|nr:hypothetical membrane protein [Thermoplasma acidophilum]
MLFSSLWYYSSSQNSPARVETTTYLDFYNSTFSKNIPLSLPVTEQIVSYGSGGAISYYDGIKINGTITNAWDEYVIYVNSSSSSTMLVLNNLSYGSYGNLRLSLRPGFYNITAMFRINIPLENGKNPSGIQYEIWRNISGNFITILIKPDSTIYIYPLAASFFAAAILMGLSILEIRRFNRNFKRR